MVMTITGSHLYLKGTFALGAGGHVTMHCNLLPHRFEIAAGGDHLSTVGGGVAHSNYTFAFAVFHDETFLRLSLKRVPIHSRPWPQPNYFQEQTPLAIVWHS